MSRVANFRKSRSRLDQIAQTATDPRVLRLVRYMREFSEVTKQRGNGYFRQGAVGRFMRAEDMVTARVQGNRPEPYEITLRYDETKGWTGSCTCPVATHCKHLYAVSLEFLQRGGTPSGEPAPEADPEVVARERAALVQQERVPVFAPLVADRTGVMPTGQEKGLCTVLDRVWHATQTDNEPAARAALDDFLNRIGVRAWAPEFQGVTIPKTSSPEAFWNQLAGELVQAKARLPKVLSPLTDDESLKEEVERQQKEARLEELRAAFARQPIHLLRGTAGLHVSEIRLRVVEQRMEWELRGTENVGLWTPVTTQELVERFNARWSDVPLVNGRSAILLQHLEHHLHSGGPRRLTLNDARSRQLLGNILAHPGTRGGVVDATEHAIEVQSERLVWHVRTTQDVETVSLVLMRHDGSHPPLGLISLGGPMNLFLSGTVAFQGPPPLPGAEADALEVELPREALEMPEAVRYLVITGAHIPEALASRVQYVMLRGRIRVSEIPNNPDGAFSLRVEALDAEGTSRFFLGPDEWEPAGRNRFAPASESAAWIPDFTDVAPLREAIFTAGFSWHRGKGSWIVAGSPGNPDRLAAWLASLPADIIREADEASKGLIEPPGRMRLSLDLRSAGQDWFDLGVTLRPDDTSLSKDEIALLLRADGRMVRLPDRGWQRLHFQMSPRDESTLAGLGLDTSAMEGTRQRFHALQLAQAPLEGLADAKQLDEIRQRADAIRSVSTPELPEDLQATLRPYQLEGFHFLAFLAANGFGGVLADDMGLGKTVQTLTWLLYLRSRKSKKLPFQVLVVCPKSVVTNWTIETAKFAPSLKSVSYSSKAATATALKKANLVIANYAQLRLGAEYFQSIEWDAVILDEGQNIKNPQSQSAQVARSLNALHRVVLTGTPVENRMMDLWSLFAFAMPGLLGTQTAFKRAFPDTGGPEVRQRLAARVRNFMLRRTKGQVAADLPARVEEDLYVELDGEQRTLYDAELKRARQQLLGIKTDKQLDKARFNILTSLLRLRQICCHPGLLDDEFKAAPSAKLDALIDQIEPVVAEGHKVLVFSQFVGMLEKISERLKESAVPHLMLTGQTENRQELVDRFQNDPAEPVFLLSLRAAGSGLNLTAASYVVLFDPWWNPAVEAQAIDRTHRIGQVNRVMAYRLLVKDTIEEKIRALQRDKAKLAGDIVQEESLATVLDLENLRYLLS